MIAEKKKRSGRVFAVSVALLMLFSVFLAVDVGSEDSDASSDSWKCTITISGNNITTMYSKNGSALATTTAVNGISQSNGSWGFDSDGYGPFGSFYAAFDSTGTLVCHLNPENLKQDIDKKDISSYGYNIMWCLPKHYVSVSGNTLTISSDSSDGTVAKSFVIEGKEYNYLAIGVYEATYDSNTGKLGSVSGETPKASTKLDDFRIYASNNSVSGGIALLWNYHMLQTYRQCALAVMGNVDSQATIGYGNANGSSSTTTGLKDAMGPYYGTLSASTTGAKCFIDDAWGSLWEYVDDAWWTSTGIDAGQNRTPTTSDPTTYKTAITLYKANCWGTTPSTVLDSWGLPTANGGSNSSSAPDYWYGGSSGYALAFGGNWGYNAYAGVSYLHYTDGGAISYFGSRLAFLFDADPAATPTVTYDHSNLTTLLKDGGTAADALTQKKTITEGGTYDQLAQQGDYKHVGWEINGTEYATTAAFVSQESHTAKSLWAKYPVATLNHDALIALGGSTTDLKTSLEITSSSVCYPDLGTTEEGFVHIGWYVDGTFYSTTHAVVKEADHTAYSAWRAPTITITFMVEGEVHSTLEVPKNSVGIVYTPKQVEGVFMGWFYDSAYQNQYDATVALAEDTMLYAKGVKPLIFTSVPTANATITSIDASGLYYFDCTANEGRQYVLWDFGDGNTSTDPIAYNSYSEPGKYKVTLTVTNATGQTAVSQYDVVYGDVQDGSGGTPWGTIALVAVFAIIAFVILRRFI